MSQASKEELRKFEQRMHDRGSDGFADGPRPWEHWDESGNQASSRVWEGSARRVYGSRKAHSLGHRLLSLLAFLALATLLVGIGGVYYTHMQTQQVAQKGIEPLPVIDRTEHVSLAPEPVPDTTTAKAVDELNVLTAPAAGTGTESEAPIVAGDDMPGDDSIASGPPALETAVAAVASRDADAEETPEAGVPEHMTTAAANSNIDAVAIETVVTERSVTTTVYTRNPQQGEPEVIAAIETTPPPFVHELEAIPETASADAAGTVTEPATAISDEITVDTSAQDTARTSDWQVAATGTDEPQDTLTLTTSGEEPATADDAAFTEPTTTEGTAIETQAETQDTIAGEQETGADQTVAATAARQVDTDPAPAEDEAVDSDTTLAVSEEPAPEENTVETSPAEEAAQIALAEPTSTIESAAPAETAEATIAEKQPIMPVARQGDWVINLASYTWKSTANKKLALFQGKGVDAEVFRVMIKDKPMYRVRVTGFESSRAAKAEVASIEQALDLEGAWVSRR
jgi:hypothetical protein